MMERPMGIGSLFRVSSIRTTMACIYGMGSPAASSTTFQPEGRRQLAAAAATCHARQPRANHSHAFDSATVKSTLPRWTCRAEPACMCHHLLLFLQRQAAAMLEGGIEQGVVQLSRQLAVLHKLLQHVIGCSLNATVNGNICHIGMAWPQLTYQPRSRKCDPLLWNPNQATAHLQIGAAAVCIRLSQQPPAQEEGQQQMTPQGSGAATKGQSECAGPQRQASRARHVH